MTGEQQQMVVKQLTQNEQAINTVKAMFLDPFNILIFLCLLVIGTGMKMSRKCEDWTIIFVVPLVGVGLAMGLLSATLHKQFYLVSFMIGIIDAGAAMCAHQVVKQTLESPLGKPLIDKAPNLARIAAIVTGADMNKANVVENVKGTGTGDGTGGTNVTQPK